MTTPPPRRRPPRDTATIHFELTVPPHTPRDARVFVAGDAHALGSWNEAAVELHRFDSHRFSTTAELPLGAQVHFKFTRGSWASVETSAFGEEVPNRMLHVQGNEKVLVRVAGWQDRPMRPPAPGPIEGRVTSLLVDSRSLRGERRVWVYQPPGDAGPGPFPLLLCLDGQNCFTWGRDSSSMPISWSLDVIADRLIRERRMAPVVIAAVANSRRRGAEYTPWRDPYIRGGGEARKTFTALRDDVMPALEKRFPIRLSPDSNGILGSSLGGLFSIWAVLQEPPVFKRAAVVSPAFFWGEATMHQFLRTRRLESGLRIWMDVGTNEIVSAANVYQDFYVASVRRVKNAIEAHGLPTASRLRYEEVEFAGHNEADWATRSDRILSFLYPPGG